MYRPLADKILSRDAAQEQIEKWRENGDRIAFTNGVFDILHVGHVSYLAETASHADRLVVGLNDDASVRSLAKGEERPLNDQRSRAGVLAALESVDAVVIFSENTPYDLIQILAPDVLVKGGDYDATCTDKSHKDYIVGSDIVKENGGDVRVIQFVTGYSTTTLVNKIKHGSQD